METNRRTASSAPAAIQFFLVPAVVMGVGLLAGAAEEAKRSPGEEDPYGRELILGGREGTLRDLVKKNPPNIAKGCLGGEPIEIDAASLGYKEHITRYSKFFRVRPDANYTLVFEVKGEGEGYVSGGVRWKHPDAPPGLVDKDDFLTVLKVPGEWTQKAVTFTSDPSPKAGDLQILLKAYGGVRASFRRVRLIEGCYFDHRWSLKRPCKPGARTW